MLRGVVYRRRFHIGGEHSRRSRLAGQCPLCGQAVDEKALAEQLKKALLSLHEASEELEKTKTNLQEIADEMGRAEEKRQALREQAQSLRVELPALPASPRPGLMQSLHASSSVDPESLVAHRERIEAWDRQARSICQEAAPPPPDAREATLVTLVQICEQIRAWRAASKKASETTGARDLADRIFAAYQDRQQKHVAGVLGKISHRVAAIYGKLHPGEDLSGVSVEPWTAKGVELAIDFHGSRQRPPHGVLSESHLNSLAIALFLAMAETFNQQLRFLVLDDVVNSFDLEHRGQLAELLADDFADWQLIVLTHDHQFYEHLIRRAPSWKRLELTSRSYEDGPRSTKYETGGMLTAARQCSRNGDTTGAAMKARRALEELLQEVCEALEASLPFRRGAANDRREIIQLSSGLRRTLKDKAKPLLKQLEPLLTNLEADVQATLNVEAHASRGRAAAAEVDACLERIEKLDETWSCTSCHTRMWVKGTPDSSRCKCGESQFPPLAD